MGWVMAGSMRYEITQPARSWSPTLLSLLLACNHVAFSLLGVRVHSPTWAYIPGWQGVQIAWLVQGFFLSVDFLDELSWSTC